MWLDKPIQLFYRIVYPAVLFFARLSRSSSHAVQVAFWADGRVLLIRNSYREGYSFPGGDVKSGERSIDAAVRELKEETGILTSADQLQLVTQYRYRYRGATIQDEMFECRAEVQPVVRIDNREVIEAVFLEPGDALSMVLFDSTRNYLSGKT